MVELKVIVAVLLHSPVGTAVVVPEGLVRNSIIVIVGDAGDGGGALGVGVLLDVPTVLVPGIVPLSFDQDETTTRSPGVCGVLGLALSGCCCSSGCLDASGTTSTGPSVCSGRLTCLGAAWLGWLDQPGLGSKF